MHADPISTNTILIPTSVPNPPWNTRAAGESDVGMAAPEQLDNSKAAIDEMLGLLADAPFFPLAEGVVPLSAPGEKMLHAVRLGIEFATLKTKLAAHEDAKEREAFGHVQADILELVTAGDGGPLRPEDLWVPTNDSDKVLRNDHFTPLTPEELENKTLLEISKCVACSLSLPAAVCRPVFSRAFFPLLLHQAS